jgi:hypothetical protein
MMQKYEEVKKKYKEDINISKSDYNISLNKTFAKADKIIKH